MSDINTLIQESFNSVFGGMDGVVRGAEIGHALGGSTGAEIGGRVGHYVGTAAGYAHDHPVLAGLTAAGLGAALARRRMKKKETAKS